VVDVVGNRYAVGHHREHQQSERVRPAGDSTREGGIRLGKRTPPYQGSRNPRGPFP
jgi:hypothetical protein